MAAIQRHTSLSLHLLLLAAVGVPGAAAGGASSYLIKSTCAALTNTTWFTPYRFCVRTLSADPAATSATDTRGLAAAAANLTAANVTSTLVVLTRLSLQQCLVQYKIMNGSVVSGLSDLRAGRLDAAWPNLKDASYMPNFCELALVEGNPKKDPLKEENQGNMLLSGMAYDIMELIAAPPY